MAAAVRCNPVSAPCFPAPMAAYRDSHPHLGELPGSNRREVIHVTNFLRQTPSQAAGLVAGGPTPDDLALWESFRSSPEAAALRAQQAASRLARRRELLSVRDRELRTLAEQASQINAAKDAAASKLKAAEAAMREAMTAARQLPSWAPETNATLDEVNRELRELVDPRLDELIGWTDFEDETTSAYGPAPIYQDIRTFRSATTKKVPDDPSTQRTIDALLRRRAALRSARREFEAMKFEALEEADFVAACDGILAKIPELPSGVSQIGPLPRGLHTTGTIPNASQRGKQEAMTAIGRQHQQARAAKAAKGWIRK